MCVMGITFPCKACRIACMPSQHSLFTRNQLTVFLFYPHNILIRSVILIAQFGLLRDIVEVSSGTCLPVPVVSYASLRNDIVL